MKGLFHLIMDRPWDKGVHSWDDLVDQRGFLILHQYPNLYLEGTDMGSMYVAGVATIDQQIEIGWGLAQDGKHYNFHRQGQEHFIKNYLMLALEAQSNCLVVKTTDDSMQWFYRSTIAHPPIMVLFGVVP